MGRKLRWGAGALIGAVAAVEGLAHANMRLQRYCQLHVDEDYICPGADEYAVEKAVNGEEVDVQLYDIYAGLPELDESLAAYVEDGLEELDGLHVNVDVTPVNAENYVDWDPLDELGFRMYKRDARKDYLSSFEDYIANDDADIAVISANGNAGVADAGSRYAFSASIPTILLHETAHKIGLMHTTNHDVMCDTMSSLIYRKLTDHQFGSQSHENWEHIKEQYDSKIL